MKLMIDLHERAHGAYLGLAVGDALGATVEFMTPNEIRAQYGVHRKMIGGGWLRLKPGRVTDDTEMALALGRALIGCGGFDARTVAEHYVGWMRSKPIDIGHTVRAGIRRFLLDGSLEAPYSEHSAGNGGAMRNLPVALATFGRPDDCAAWSLAQARLTHHHPEADAGTIALAQMTQALLEGGGIKACRPIVNALIAAHPAFRFDPYRGLSSGYIVETLRAVFHGLFYTDSFENCLVEVVNRGGDADTTGALSGMLAGALYGERAIPGEWLDRLDGNVVREISAQTDELLALALRLSRRR